MNPATELNVFLVGLALLVSMIGLGLR